jgi:hypothetical protein
VGRAVPRAGLTAAERGRPTTWLAGSAPVMDHR